ncbi:PIN domain-containing protein [Bacillus sp. DJP31]|uniref:PIN domain-containing protein n=1 Tax=Bacillus sp. DJP31 TaxID=3409789 RepID=UPI003BB568FE
MNQNSYNNTPSVMFDTTVLCGALITDGVNRQLLRLASQTVDFHPILSKVCLLEFYKKAVYDGISGMKYKKELVEDFLELFVYPILSNSPAVNSKVGRYHSEIIRRNEMRIGQALAEISGFSTTNAVSLIEDAGLQDPLRYYDEQEVPVWVTAIHEKCRFIVTSNTKRFPKSIGNIIRVRPGDFFNMFMD